MTFKNILSTTTLNKNDILSETFSTSKTIAFSEASFFFLQNKQLSTRCSFHKCHILVSIWWIELTSYKWLRDRSYTITLSTVYKTHNHNMTKNRGLPDKNFSDNSKKSGKKVCHKHVCILHYLFTFGLWEEKKEKVYSCCCINKNVSVFI